MAVDEVTTWTTTTKDNTSPIPPGPDGKRPGRVGLAMQEFMASIARWAATVITTVGGQTIAGPLTLSDATAANFTVSGPAARLRAEETDAGVDEKCWGWHMFNGSWYATAYPDDFGLTGANHAIEFGRTGLVLDVPKVTDGSGAGAMKDVIHAGGSQKIDNSLRIDTATLSSWTANASVMQLSTTAAVVGHDDTTFRHLWLMENAYYDGTNWRRIVDSEASMHILDKGKHKLRVVATSTADSIITWINALTIDVTGNTTLSGDLTVGGYIQSNTATNTELNDIANAINTDAGKKQGAMVFNATLNVPVYAVGSADGSVWVDGAGTTVNTPA